jgi:phospholipid/cholesterol/gamma-HCH transport system permease protein
MLVMLPALTVFGNCFGVVGGWTISRYALGQDTAAFLLRGLQAADTWDLYSGLIKSLAFAWLIGTIACHTGMSVEGGAEGVGRATTQSVVASILAMLITNAGLTAVFFFCT